MQIRYALAMTQSVKAVVFPVAGRGTRFLPVTKASPTLSTTPNQAVVSQGIATTLTDTATLAGAYAQTGNITTRGQGATGLFAQSAGGQGTGGDRRGAGSGNSNDRRGVGAPQGGERRNPQAAPANSAMAEALRRAGLLNDKGTHSKDRRSDRP